MAAVTPTTLIEASAGDLKLHIARFAATTDNTDTWASGIPGIVGVMCSQGDTAGTQAATGAGASFSGSTITFHIGENDSAVELWVLSRS
jgi:hypothetical protein